jgi:mono/diheme cytochrome c family protein
MSRRSAAVVIVALVVLIAAAGIVYALLPGRLALAADAFQKPDPQSFEDIERGRYLATAADCAACHTARGGKPFAGGLPIETPFGTLVAPNITPDRESGIGAWTDDEFRRAMQDGIGRDGEFLYPAMPYPAYAKLARDDLLAIRAYLATVESVSNKVVSNQLPFPFRIRTVMLGWNLLNFDRAPFHPDPNAPAERNRGAYLVDGLGHCGTCHSAKNILGGDKRDGYLQGAVLQGWFVPNITSDPRVGIGAWPPEEIVDYLKAGANHWTVVSGPMAEEVRNSSAYMTDADLRAIAIYLKGVPPAAAASPGPLPSSDARMVSGQAIYRDVCSACHTEQGLGADHLFPRLARSPAVQSDNATTLVRVVVAGSRSGGTKLAPTAPAMPAMAGRLTNEQIAAVLTYIRNAWGNAAAAVSADEVKVIKISLKANDG